MSADLDSLRMGTLSVVVVLGLAGLVVGWLIKRWAVVVALIVALLVLSAAGIGFGWFGDADMPAVGSALILWLYFIGPFQVGLAVGVLLGQARVHARH